MGGWVGGWVDGWFDGQTARSNHHSDSFAVTITHQQPTHPPTYLLDLGEVGQGQLEVDDLHVPLRVHGARHVDDVVVLEATDHLRRWVHGWVGGWVGEKREEDRATEPDTWLMSSSSTQRITYIGGRGGWVAGWALGVVYRKQKQKTHLSTNPDTKKTPNPPTYPTQPTPPYLHNRIALPNIGQKLVPQAFPLRGPLHQPRNIHEFQHSRQHRLGLGDVREGKKAGVGDLGGWVVEVGGWMRWVGGKECVPRQSRRWAQWCRRGSCKEKREMR